MHSLRFSFRPKTVVRAFVLLLLLVGCGLIIQKFKAPSQQGADYSALGINSPCPGAKRSFVMSDVYLPGVLDVGVKFKADWNWYACNQPKVGEVALVRMSQQLAPQAKVIRAVPGDRLDLKWNEQLKGWNILVNSESVLDFKGKAYTFGVPFPPPLQHYLNTHGHVLGPSDVVVLSTRPPGNLDSGMWGAVSVTDLVARVQ